MAPGYRRRGGGNWREDAYAQISESYVGRTLRTARYTYCVWAPGLDPRQAPFAARYAERFLFDNAADPNQRENLVADPALAGLRARLAQRLKARAAEAGEPPFEIDPVPAGA